MVGLQYFATFLHVAKLPGVPQLSAGNSDLELVWMLWEPMIQTIIPNTEMILGVAGSVVLSLLWCWLRNDVWVMIQDGAGWGECSAVFCSF